MVQETINDSGNVLLDIELLLEPRRTFRDVGGQQLPQLRLVRAWNKGDQLGHAMPPRPASVPWRRIGDLPQRSQ